MFNEAPLDKRQQQYHLNIHCFPSYYLNNMPINQLVQISVQNKIYAKIDGSHIELFKADYNTTESRKANYFTYILPK